MNGDKQANQPTSDTTAAPGPVQPLVRRFNWMRSNFCEGHAEMAEMSSSACPWCRLAASKKAAWTVVNAYDTAHGHLVRNIEALRDWLEADDS